MLHFLRVENFALIDALELSFDQGLTVLTGETGAGKSIILDAIDAVLGGRVTSRAVRSGTERAILEASFALDQFLSDWLHQQNLDSFDDELVISREVTITSGGQRSRSRVNGVQVNKQQLEQIRQHLVEITAQGQTVQLGHPPLQREWLDSYGGVSLQQQQQQVAQVFAAYQQATQTLEKRRQSEQQRLQQLDLFQYQLQELTQAALTEPEELEQLEQERNRLSHSVELQQQSYQVYQLLYAADGEADACTDLLGRAHHLLQQMTAFDDSLQPFLNQVVDTLEQVQGVGRQINLYGESLEADPDRLQEVQERIGALKQICRKYGPTLADAIDLRDRRQQEILELTAGGQSLAELEAIKQAQYGRLIQICADLTSRRKTAAQDLEQRLVNELKPLAMEKVQFQVSVTPCPPSATGADQVTFMFSPNPGEPLQPLTEIASGGEMSRFLLALQASFSQVDPVGTLVFDEIDVGVSGRVTQAIAEKLYQLSHHHQVLCVTHQPIVAAMADQHLRVSKQVIGEDPSPANGQSRAKRRKQESKGSDPAAEVRTVVRVSRLSQAERREELAQLAGGQTDQNAIAFADALLSQALELRHASQSLAPMSTKA